MERINKIKNQLLFVNNVSSPFHLAIPIPNLKDGKEFYGNVLQLEEGRSDPNWQDYNLGGNQIVIHVVKGYKPNLYYNDVDDDPIPVPHFGCVLSEKEFHELIEKIKDKVEFIVKPHKRFVGLKGEQWTCFFLDPFKNALEFKAMTNPDYLFEKQ